MDLNQGMYPCVKLPECPDFTSRRAVKREAECTVILKRAQWALRAAQRAEIVSASSRALPFRDLRGCLSYIAPFQKLVSF